MNGLRTRNCAQMLFWKQNMMTEIPGHTFASNHLIKLSRLLQMSIWDTHYVQLSLPPPTPLPSVRGNKCSGRAFQEGEASLTVGKSDGKLTLSFLPPSSAFFICNTFQCGAVWVANDALWVTLSNFQLSVAPASRDILCCDRCLPSHLCLSGIFVIILWILRGWYKLCQSTTTTAVQV